MRERIRIIQVIKIDSNVARSSYNFAAAFWMGLAGQAPMCPIKATIMVQVPVVHPTQS